MEMSGQPQALEALPYGTTPVPTE